MNLHEAKLLAESVKIEGQKGSSTTQVATTKSTYVKSGKDLKDKIPHDAKVLNYGAGLDHTSEGIKEGLGEGKHTVHDYEPFPERRKAKPTYTDSSEIPNNHYHAVVCHNVLNVVQPHIRHAITKHIFDTMKEGGVAHIGTRKYKGDIDQAKNASPASDEDKALWIHKKGGDVYQKGFDGDELKQYVESQAKKHGHQVEVKKNNMAANGVEVKMIKKGDSK